MSRCKKCSRELVSDEIALTKKLINRGSTEFYCLSCLAGMFECSEDLLREKIDYFKKSGCTLF